MCSQFCLCCLTRALNPDPLGVIPLRHLYALLRRVDLVDIAERRIGQAAVSCPRVAHLVAQVAPAKLGPAVAARDGADAAAHERKRDVVELVERGVDVGARAEAEEDSAACGALDGERAREGLALPPQDEVEE